MRRTQRGVHRLECAWLSNAALLCALFAVSIPTSAAQLSVYAGVGTGLRFYANGGHANGVSISTNIWRYLTADPVAGTQMIGSNSGAASYIATLGAGFPQVSSTSTAYSSGGGGSQPSGLWFQNASLAWMAEADAGLQRFQRAGTTGLMAWQQTYTSPEGWGARAVTGRAITGGSGYQLYVLTVPNVAANMSTVYAVSSTTIVRSIRQDAACVVPRTCPPYTR